MLYKTLPAKAALVFISDWNFVKTLNTFLIADLTEGPTLAMMGLGPRTEPEPLVAKPPESGELEYDDLDDEELNYYILSIDERVIKYKQWMAENEDYVKAQEGLNLPSWVEEFNVITYGVQKKQRRRREIGQTGSPRRKSAKPRGKSRRLLAAQLAKL